MLFVLFFIHDSDNDGLLDSQEKGPVDCCAPLPGKSGSPVDTDGNGVPDYRQSNDSDNDGIPDSHEIGSDANIPVDTDNDGTPDYLDLDR